MNLDPKEKEEVIIPDKDFDRLVSAVAQRLGVRRVVATAVSPTREVREQGDLPIEKIEI